MNQTALNQIATVVLRIFSIIYFAGAFFDLANLPDALYGFASYRGGYYKNIHAIIFAENCARLVFNIVFGIILFKYAKPLAAFFTRGLQDHVNPDNDEGVWPPAPRRPESN